MIVKTVRIIFHLFLIMYIIGILTFMFCHACLPSGRPDRRQAGLPN
jgi:phage shock protein PspC (stress-responsive transcriptional regulator)